MVTFAPENAPALKFTVYEMRNSAWSQGSLALCFYQENFHLPGCSCITTIVVLGDSRFSTEQVRTTESMRDFFLLNLRKTPGVRANAALRFLSRNTHYVANLKIAIHPRATRPWP